MQEIFTFLVPVPEEYIYLEAYQRFNYYKEPFSRSISVKVLRKGVQTFANLKTHIRQILLLPPESPIGIRYGHQTYPADTANIPTTYLRLAPLQYGSPDQPLHLLLSTLPK